MASFKDKFLKDLEDLSADESEEEKKSTHKENEEESYENNEG
jgi:hypothetical protein